MKFLNKNTVSQLLLKHIKDTAISLYENNGFTPKEELDYTEIQYSNYIISEIMNYCQYNIPYNIREEFNNINPDILEEIIITGEKNDWNI